MMPDSHHMHKYAISGMESMREEIIDDVKALLDGDFEDDQILKDIYRACRNGEVISNYERKYVRDLAEHYLKKAPRMAQDPAEPAFVPDVVLPEPTGVSDDVGQKSTVQSAAEQPVVGPVHLASTTPKGRSGKNKIVAGAVGGVLAVIAVAFVAYGGLGDAPEDGEDLPEVPDVPVDTSEPKLHVKTDLTEYSRGNIISISGWSDAQNMDVGLVIANPAGTHVWTETVSMMDDSTYSTLAIAGGPGWEEPGTYVVQADDGGGAVVTQQFEILQ